MSIQTPLANDSFACPECGADQIAIQYVNDSFEYGSGKEVAVLKVTVPVHVCGNCACQFDSEEGDKIRHDAICAHLGLLSPREILHIRVSSGMSQSKLAEITGIGVASISRWESGQLLQSRSNDRLLRLVESPTNVEFLEAMVTGKAKPITEIEKKKVSIEARALTGVKLTNAIDGGNVFKLRKVA